MAWNPSPEVAVARDFAAKFGADRVIIFYTTPDGKYGYASYGQNRELCGATRKAADAVHDHMGRAFADTDPR